MHEPRLHSVPGDRKQWLRTCERYCTAGQPPPALFSSTTNRASLDLPWLDFAWFFPKRPHKLRTPPWAVLHPQLVAAGGRVAWAAKIELAMHTGNVGSTQRKVLSSVAKASPTEMLINEVCAPGGGGRPTEAVEGPPLRSLPSDCRPDGCMAVGCHNGHDGQRSLGATRRLGSAAFAPRHIFIGDLIHRLALPFHSQPLPLIHSSSSAIIHSPSLSFTALHRRPRQDYPALRRARPPSHRRLSAAQVNEPRWTTDGRPIVTACH